MSWFVYLRSIGRQECCLCQCYGEFPTGSSIYLQPEHIECLWHMWMKMHFIYILFVLFAMKQIGLFHLSLRLTFNFRLYRTDLQTIEATSVYILLTWFWSFCLEHRITFEYCSFKLFHLFEISTRKAEFDWQ